MTAMTKMKPIMLSSKNLRTMMTGNGRNSYAFIKAATAIDEMSRLHDALDTLHRTPSAQLTKEGRAAKYRQQFDRAMAASKAAALAAVDALNAHEAELIRDAEIKAGLHTHVLEVTQQEIRQALRELPQAQRDQAVREAAMRGDASVIAAVRNAASPLLTGLINVPIDELVQMLVAKHSPGLDDELQDVSTAVDLLQGAVNAFTREAEARRDPHLEAEAQRQDAATQAADAAIAAVATGSAKPAEPITLPTELPTE